MCTLGAGPAAHAHPGAPPRRAQVKESKRQFIFDVVNEGGESEKMELFVSFCEDTIFEMQIAAQISEPEGEPEADDDDGAAEAGVEGAEEGAAGPEGAAVPPGASSASILKSLRPTRHSGRCPR